MTSDTLKVLIVRHGQTNYNKKHILQGHVDTSLNEKGLTEASLAGKRLLEMGIDLDAVWSSDLTRCVQTTDQILKFGKQDHLRVEYLTDLRERCMGDLEGMRVIDANAKCQREGKHFHDYGEPRHYAVKRLNTAFDKIVTESLSKNYNTIMIVSHGGVISKFIAHLVKDEGFVFSDNVKAEDIRVPHNTSITTVMVDKKSKTGVVESFGDASHLGTNLLEVGQAEK